MLWRVPRDRLAPLWTMAIYLGCRLWELLALKWSNVDLDRGVAVIRWTLVPTGSGVPELGEPKSFTSRRTVGLPPDAV